MKLVTQNQVPGCPGAPKVPLEILVAPAPCSRRVDRWVRRWKRYERQCPSEVEALKTLGSMILAMICAPFILAVFWAVTVLAFCLSDK